MRVIVKHGDILLEQVDVLVSTANPQLNMSGGINGEILVRGGLAVQQELRAYQAKIGRKWVEAGTVVTTGPGPTPARHIIHAVSIDPWYHSDVDLIRRTVEAALTEAARLNAHTVALPALATGYGRLPMPEFAAGLKLALGRKYPPVEELRVVVRREEESHVVRSVLSGEGEQPGQSDGKHRTDRSG